MVEQGLAGIVRSASLELVDRQLCLAGPRVRSVSNLNQTLLFFAVQRQERALEVCKLLVNVHGVNAQQIDKRGQTALHYLACTQNVDCVELLIEKRCAMDHNDGLLNQTPLFYAAHKGTAAMVQTMLAHRADASYRDRQGKTPLCWAAQPDTSKELAQHCALFGGACDSKQAILMSTEWHRQNQRPDCARYLAACAEAWTLRGCLSWVARKDSNKMGAYATCLARARDVKQLCLLEDEFISDHRDILPKDGGTDLYEQIGLNPDPSVRLATVKSIASAGHQNGAVKHYTVSCYFLPENARDQQGSARARSYETVGYVYFRICHGEKGDDDEETTLAKQKGKPLSNIGHIVISHIKVAKSHQKKGVATLLLASALRQTELRLPNFVCKDMHLLVAHTNKAASALYRKLGFVPAKANDHRGWISMKRQVTEPSLASIRELWLRMVWSRKDRLLARPEEPTGGFLTTSSLAGVKDGGTAHTGSRKRRLSSSASNVSDVSTAVGSATSSGWSAYSCSTA
jgi:ribosomal protein S18 acetylase RimI-like enzyme